METHTTLALILSFLMLSFLMVMLFLCSGNKETRKELRTLRAEKRTRHRSPPANAIQFLYGEFNLLLMMVSVPRSVQNLRSQIDAEEVPWIKTAYQAAYVIFVGLG